MFGDFGIGITCYCRELNTEWWVIFIAYNNVDKKREMEIPASYILFLWLVFSLECTGERMARPWRWTGSDSNIHVATDGADRKQQVL
jgi:hypothetical protein